MSFPPLPPVNCGLMEGTERDSTEEWLLPEGAGPPLLNELELRIDEALAIARASEQAVQVVGDAAIDAAKQARRAAELAERASVSALEASRSAAAGAAEVHPERTPPRPSGRPGDPSLRGFSERADRVVARLRALERLPVRARASTAAAGHRRPGG
jgi:hypothetical protein